MYANCECCGKANIYGAVTLPVIDSENKWRCLTLCRDCYQDEAKVVKLVKEKGWD